MPETVTSWIDDKGVTHIKIEPCPGCDDPDCEPCCYDQACKYLEQLEKDGNSDG